MVFGVGDVPFGCSHIQITATVDARRPEHQWHLDGAVRLHSQPADGQSAPKWHAQFEPDLIWAGHLPTMRSARRSALSPEHCRRWSNEPRSLKSFLTTDQSKFRPELRSHSLELSATQP